MRMIKQNYRRDGTCGPHPAQLDRLWRTMDARPALTPGAEPSPPPNSGRRAADDSRAGLLLGVFDFLRGREEYRLLGQAEVYEEYAREVGLSATAENGDDAHRRPGGHGRQVLHRLLLRQLRPADESLVRAGRCHIRIRPPDLWQARQLAPVFSLYAGEGAPRRRAL